MKQTHWQQITSNFLFPAGEFYYYLNNSLMWTWWASHLWLYPMKLKTEAWQIYVLVMFCVSVWWLCVSPFSVFWTFTLTLLLLQKRWGRLVLKLRYQPCLYLRVPSEVEMQNTSHHFAILYGLYTGFKSFIPKVFGENTAWNPILYITL